MPKLDERDTDKIVPTVFYVIIAVTVTITVIQLNGVRSWEMNRKYWGMAEKMLIGCSG